MKKTQEKVVFESQRLGREVHLDVFEFGKPETTLLLFGGSGIDDEEYQLRKESIIPLFDSVEVHDLKNIRVVHATAPFDIPFARFDEFPNEISKWNRHVIGEIFERWKDGSYLVSSFSGSVSLILNGIERERRCLGAAVLAPDGLKPDFSSPKHWRDSLVVFTSPNDRVCSHPENRMAIQTLVESGEAQEVEVAARSHTLFEYVRQTPFLDWIGSRA